jgi:hypothetical protein
MALFTPAVRGPGVYEGPLQSSEEDIVNTEFYRELYGRRIYNYDAVSGSQIVIKFGENVLLDDATAIQFSLSQSKKPIYGYHSQYFDTVASGVVIVHGRLFINFIHQGYLRLLMNKVQNPQFLDMLDSEGKREAERANYGHGVTNDGLPSSQEAVFEFVRRDAAKRQEQEINYAANHLKDRPDLFAALTKIQIKYGNENEFDQVPEKIIHDVHFIGEGQEIQISGQPIQEMYEFMARRVT